MFYFIRSSAYEIYKNIQTIKNSNKEYFVFQKLYILNVLIGQNDPTGHPNNPYGIIYVVFLIKYTNYQHVLRIANI
jgi:hypothetical protein